ncbi:hypothetical protein [Lysobacter sp. CA196]|uniref:hypothetical protein n=1 Tax=Lysobacter sp. CA196 TaxID=3455606 RepID=UPI003F8D386D
MLLFLRGRYAEGLEIVDQAECLLPLLPVGQPESEAHAQMACTRVWPLVALGRVPEARRNQERCARGNAPASRYRALLSKIDIEILVGDRVQAATLLGQAEQALPNMPPERWIHLMEVARLANELGEREKSERIYAQLLSQLRPTGFSGLVAQTLTGQAESAAVRGDWERSRPLAAEARRLLRGEVWFLGRRLDLLDIVDARGRGDEPAAVAMASKLHAPVHQLGDVVAQMQLHSLFEPGALEGDCSAAEREALVARTGMRGIHLDWLTPARGMAQGAAH